MCYIYNTATVISLLTGLERERGERGREKEEERGREKQRYRVTMFEMGNHTADRRRVLHLQHSNSHIITDRSGEGERGEREGERGGEREREIKIQGHHV